jgi:hypothetical protein
MNRSGESTELGRPKLRSWFLTGLLLPACPLQSLSLISTDVLQPSWTSNLAVTSHDCGLPHLAERHSFSCFLLQPCLTMAPEGTCATTLLCLGTCFPSTWKTSCSLSLSYLWLSLHVHSLGFFPGSLGCMKNPYSVLISCASVSSGIIVYILITFLYICPVCLPCWVVSFLTISLNLPFNCWSQDRSQQTQV